MAGVGSVLAWVDWVGCLHEWRGWGPYVGGEGGLLARLVGTEALS